MAGHALERAALRDLRCARGVLMPLVSGSVLVPLGFLALPAHPMPGPPMLRGMVWAGYLWAALETLVAPRLGAGVFHAALGGFPAALRALLGHLVSGAMRGGLGGAPAPTDQEMAPPWYAGSKEADTRRCSPRERTMPSSCPSNGHHHRLL
jgi:hypothetical protein